MLNFSKKLNENILNIYVDGGIRRGRAFSSVYCKGSEFEYSLLLGGYGDINSTDAEGIAIFYGMDLALRLFEINPYYNINIFTDLEFLYNIFSERYRVKVSYYNTHKSLSKLITHPVMDHFNSDLFIKKIPSKDNKAHFVITGTERKIDEETITFFSEEFLKKWNAYDTSVGCLELGLRDCFISCKENKNCETCNLGQEGECSALLYKEELENRYIGVFIKDTED